MLERDEYIRKLLAAYRTTPGTSGLVRRGDRMLAEQLYERAVPLTAALNALVLAAARRLSRAGDAPPLPPVRSLAYFVAIIDEVLRTEAGQDYYDHLRNSLPPLTPR